MLFLWVRYVIGMGAPSIINEPIYGLLRSRGRAVMQQINASPPLPDTDDGERYNA